MTRLELVVAGVIAAAITFLLGMALGVAQPWDMDSLEVQIGA